MESENFTGAVADFLTASVHSPLALWDRFYRHYGEISHVTLVRSVLRVETGLGFKLLFCSHVL